MCVCPCVFSFLLFYKQSEDIFAGPVSGLSVDFLGCVLCWGWEVQNLMTAKVEVMKSVTHDYVNKAFRVFLNFRLWHL